MRRLIVRGPRRDWVFPRTQPQLEELLNNSAMRSLVKENFRVSRNAFNYICGPINPAICVSRWRLSSDWPRKFYRSCGLMFGAFEINTSCHEFVRELCLLLNQFILQSFQTLGSNAFLQNEKET